MHQDFHEEHESKRHILAQQLVTFHRKVQNHEGKEQG